MSIATIGIYLALAALAFLYLMSERTAKGLEERCSELEKHYDELLVLLPPDDFADGT